MDLYRTSFLFILLHCELFTCLTITSPPELQTHLLSPQFIWFGQQPPYNLTGAIVMADPSTACRKTLQNSDQTQGKIVLVDWGKKRRNLESPNNKV
jgi:hypothetical protein